MMRLSYARKFPPAASSRRLSAARRMPATVLLLVLWLLLSGCQPELLLPQFARANGLHSVHDGNKRASTNDALERWIEQELGPYLVAQVGRHPRFQGQRLAVVKMDGAEVSPQMDQLTAHLRDRIDNILLTIPQSQLAWQAQDDPALNASGPLQCNRKQPLDYLIGLELKLLGRQRLDVSVKALDLDDRSWLGGFGKHWQGTITPAQQQALHSLQADESLRGLRELPFESHQADVAARYLAHGLSCQLLQQSTESGKLYIETEHTDPFVHTTFKLLGHYLAQYRQAAITDRRSDAELILSAERQPIHPQLDQLWVAARTHDGERIAGLTAETYVRPATASQPVAVIPAATVAATQKPPQVNKPQPEPAPRATGIAEPVTVIETPSPPSGHRPPRQRGPELLQVLVPSHLRQCHTRQPWRQGERHLPTDDFPGQAACFALQLRIPADQQAFLIKQRADGSLLRLAPDRCRGLVRTMDRRSGIDTLRFPSKYLSGSRAVLWPDINDAGYFAITAASGQAATQVRQQLTKLPGACDGSRGVLREAGQQQRWLQEMEDLAARSDAVQLHPLPVQPAARRFSEHRQRW